MIGEVSATYQSLEMVGSTMATHSMLDMPADIPLDSPLRKYPKKGLPPEFASTYPHGHISGQPRTPKQQAALETRRKEILHTLTAAEIDEKYSEVCEQIKTATAEIDQDQRKWKQEVDDLKRKREVERRVWKRMNEQSRVSQNDPDEMQE